MHKRLVRIAALVVINVAFIALLEIASYSILAKFRPKHRYRPPLKRVENQFHPYLGHIHPPNARIQTNRPSTGPTFIETDTEGNSKTPLALENPQIQIAVTGGSTMFGTGSSSNDETVPSLIERMINDKLGVRAEVVNLGKRGYASFHETVLLDRYLASHQVDLVLAISGFNDAHHAFNFPDIEFGFLTPEVWKEAVPLQRRAERGDLIVLNWADKLSSISHTFDLLHALATGLRKEPPAPDKETDPPEGANTLENVPERVRLSIVHYSMMNTLAHLRGAEFALFLQPNSKVRPRETFSPDEAAKEPTSRKRRQFTYYNAYFEGIRAADKEFIFHDITGIFPPETAPFYYDLAHYTDRGAAVVAESVVDRIKPLIDKKLHEKSQTGDAHR